MMYLLFILLLKLEVRNYNVIVSSNHCYIVKLLIYHVKLRNPSKNPQPQRMFHGYGWSVACPDTRNHYQEHITSTSEISHFVCE